MRRRRLHTGQAPLGDQLKPNSSDSTNWPEAQHRQQFPEQRPGAAVLLLRCPSLTFDDFASSPSSPVDCDDEERASSTERGKLYGTQSNSYLCVIGVTISKNNNNQKKKSSSTKNHCAFVIFVFFFSTDEIASPPRHDTGKLIQDTHTQ